MNGSEMVEAACQAASIPTACLYANTAECGYARAGWRTVGVVQREIKCPVTLMLKELKVRVV